MTALRGRGAAPEPRELAHDFPTCSHQHPQRVRATGRASERAKREREREGGGRGREVLGKVGVE